jgi:AcrR family transcriptional regulator
MSKAEKRKKICDIATKLFVEKGFEKTTTRDIASASGMNTSAIYYYFEDKESILYNVLIDLMNNSLRQMREIERCDISLKEKINAVIKLHTQIYGIDPNTMELIVYNQKSLNREHWEELRLKQREYTKIVVRILDEMKEKGEIADLNTRACTVALFGMVQWAHSWYTPKGEIAPDQLCDIVTYIFTKGTYSDQKESKEPNRKVNRVISGVRQLR